MKQNTKPEVNTHQYEYSHGRKPRGRGSWAFATNPSPIPQMIYWASAMFKGDNGESYVCTSLTYGEAKKAAQEHFRGCSRIYVLS